MSPVLIGAVGVALWTVPGLLVCWVIWRTCFRSEHQPDPVFDDDLEQLWSMPTRDHA